MAKLPLIAIRPNYDNVPTPDLYDRQFIDAGGATDFMIAKLWRDWVLYIHGRKYEWPQNKGSVERHVLKNHIMNCIDTDIAFYGRA